MEEEKFIKFKTKEENLKDALDFLDETRFNFACFVDSFTKFSKKFEAKLETIEKIDKNGKRRLD